MNQPALVQNLDNPAEQDDRLIEEQQHVFDQLDTVMRIFANSKAEIRPHFLLTGPSGSGKSHLVAQLANEHKFGFVEVNAAQLTKEGTAGNSLSKALTALAPLQHKLTIVFVDEFDKLFISGNVNSQLAHETTNGVQNEFLKVLESRTTAVYGEYGKYFDVSTEKVLYVFAGAFNGAEDLTLDKLREYGIKTEFLGRVGLIYNLTKLSLKSMRVALDRSKLLADYLQLFPEVKKIDVTTAVMEVVEAQHENNTLGIRLINTLLHQFFINGGKLDAQEVKSGTFQTAMTLKG